MTSTQEYIIKNKLPNLIISLLNYHSVSDIKKYSKCTHDELLSWIAKESFPTKTQLKNLCEKFKIDYNTAKTWHLYSTN